MTNTNDIKCKFLPYKLIGDCTYPMQIQIYSPLKGYIEGLEGYKAINLANLNAN